LRKIFRLAALAAMLLPALPAVAATWDAYTYYTVSTVAAVRGLNRLIDRVAKETDGQLQIRLHLGGTIPINGGNITSAVGDDDVQMATDAFFSGNVGIVALLQLPMLVQSPAEYDRAEQVLLPYIAKAYDQRGVKFLGQFIYPAQVFWSRKKLTSLADLQGQKMRVTGPEIGELVHAFGGVPVTLSTAEVPAALDRGVIDGAQTASSGAGYVWRDLLKYRYDLGVSYISSELIANKADFQALSPHTQAVLQQAATEAVSWMTMTMKAEEDDLTAKMVSGGLTLAPAVAADQQEAERRMKPIWDAWAKAHGPEAEQALGQVRALLGR
jgi:TRAP-type C4-dicarboxylate transport system substrate-binding protein